MVIIELICVYLEMDYQNHVPTQVNHPKQETQTNTAELPKVVQREPASITSLHHFDTYASSKGICNNMDCLLLTLTIF